MNKILTISIAAYNAEKYIKKAIESCIISDKYINFIEVIIVNDGSNDMTLCIAQEYERKYPNIVRIINKENGGYGSTINNSIKMASGKYFKLLDADDWFDTNNLEYLMKILMTTEDDMILTDYLLYYGESKTSNHIKFMLAPNKCLKIENLDFRTNLLMHGICYKTEILKKNYIEISEHCFYTDMEYVISYLPYIKTVRCNGVQREHNKKLNNGLPILHKVPPKRDYGRYFCIMAEKGGTSHGGLTEKLSPFFHAKKQEVNAYGR